MKFFLFLFFYLPETPLGLAGLPAGDAGLSGLVGKNAEEILLSGK